MKYLMRKMYMFLGGSIVFIILNFKYNFVEINFFDKYIEISKNEYSNLIEIISELIDGKETNDIKTNYDELKEKNIKYNSKNELIYSRKDSSSETKVIMHNSGRTKKEINKELKKYINQEETKQKIKKIIEKKKDINKELNDMKIINKKNTDNNSIKFKNKNKSENKNPIIDSKETIEDLNKQIEKMNQEIEKIGL